MYDIPNMLSNLGGTLGMYLGLSLLDSLVGILDYIKAKLYWYSSVWYDILWSLVTTYVINFCQEIMILLEKRVKFIMCRDSYVIKQIDARHCIYKVWDSGFSILEWMCSKESISTMIFAPLSLEICLRIELSSHKPIESCTYSVIVISDKVNKVSCRVASIF